MGGMHHLSIDIETYSDVEISKTGLYRYAQSPAFEVLLFGYSLDGAPPRVIDLARGEQIPPGDHPALHEPVHAQARLQRRF